jgi:hypothetical protein
MNNPKAVRRASHPPLELGEEAGGGNAKKIVAGIRETNSRKQLVISSAACIGDLIPGAVYGRSQSGQPAADDVPTGIFFEANKDVRGMPARMIVKNVRLKIRQFGPVCVYVADWLPERIYRLHKR